MPGVGEHRRIEQVAEREGGGVDAFDRKPDDRHHRRTPPCAPHDHACSSRSPALGPDEEQEHDPADQHEHRRVGPEPDESVDHPDGATPLLGREQARRQLANVLLRTDRERERATDRMRVRRDHPPRDHVGSRTESRQRRLDRRAVTVRVRRCADVDEPPACVVQPDTAELDADRLAEMQRHRPRRSRDCIDRVRGRIRALELRVRERGSSGGDEHDDRGGAQSHGASDRLAESERLAHRMFPV